MVNRVAAVLDTTVLNTQTAIAFQNVLECSFYTVNLLQYYIVYIVIYCTLKYLFKYDLIKKTMYSTVFPAHTLEMPINKYLYQLYG